MTDIRKRTGAKGTTYQVRYPSTATKSGYAYATFETMKEARAFREDAAARIVTSNRRKSCTVAEAVAEWLDICEKEGLNGREPVTDYTLENYTYRAGFITAYDWDKTIAELTAPDIVAFRSHLLRNGLSRDLAGKVMFSLQSMMKEMLVRGSIEMNCAAGIGIRADSRYDEPVVIPTKAEIKSLLRAADDLSNATNQTVAKAWRKYRPMLYLAVDSGMRPQEYLAAATASLDNSGISVERALDGDGSRISVTKTAAGRRYIDLTPGTVDLVRHYVDKWGIDNPHDLIFPDANGKWMSRRNWQRRGFNIACEKAGLIVEEERDDGSAVEVPKFRPYDLRHFFASYHIDKGTNLKKLQKMMGHNDIQTTLNVYGHLLEDDKSTAKGLLGDL
jgi:integrase